MLQATNGLDYLWLAKYIFAQSADCLRNLKILRLRSAICRLRKIPRLRGTCTCSCRHQSVWLSSMSLQVTCRQLTVYSHTVAITHIQSHKFTLLSYRFVRWKSLGCASSHDGAFSGLHMRLKAMKKTSFLQTHTYTGTQAGKNQTESAMRHVPAISQVNAK